MASNQSKRRRRRRSFGAIRQLASGNYQASYKALDGSTQVAPQTFKTREAADKYLAIKQAEQIAEKQASAAGLQSFGQLIQKHRKAFGSFMPRLFRGSIPP